MEAQSIFRYYAFGFDFCLLKTAMANRKREEAVGIVKRFLRNLERLELEVTTEVASAIHPLLVALELGKDERISRDEWGKIDEIVLRLEPTLDAELKLRSLYVLTKKRFPTRTLLHSPMDLLAKDVAGSLSAHAQRDYQLACEQIALNQGTASAFHLLRMLEDHLKQMYFAFKRTKRLKTPMWGPMIKELRQKNSPRPSDKLLDHLDSIRAHFRNPTQHPELFYNIDQAQDLLSQSIAALGMMCAEFPSRVKAAGQAASSTSAHPASSTGKI